VAAEPNLASRGETAATALATVVLYSKPGCHLCDEAATILRRLASEQILRWRAVDITTDPALFERFKFRIPVLEIDSGPILDWPTTVERVRKAVLTRQ